MTDEQEQAIPAGQSAASSASGPTHREVSIEPFDNERRRCAATVRSTGQRCKKFPIKYANVCRSHGGAAPQVRAAAKRREIEAGAMVALSKSNIEPLDNPLQALLDLGAEMIAFKDVLGTQVERLSTADLTHVDMKGQQFLSALASSFSASLKDCGALLVAINKLGILERRQRLSEAEYRGIATAVHDAVWSHAARLDDETAERVLAAIHAELVRVDYAQ